MLRTTIGLVAVGVCAVTSAASAQVMYQTMDYNGEYVWGASASEACQAVAASYNAANPPFYYDSGEPEDPSLGDSCSGGGMIAVSYHPFAEDDYTCVLDFTDSYCGEVTSTQLNPETIPIYVHCPWDGDYCAVEACAGEPCNYGQECNSNSYCEMGVCVAGSADDGQACDDGDACTVADVCEAGSCAGEPILNEFEGDSFIGQPVRAHVDFLDALDRVDQIAMNNDVLVVVTHSFRAEGAEVVDAIVEPATASNHLVGHGIDMNPRYDGVTYTSASMLDFVSLPLPVQSFLNDVRDDQGLRWGGDFGTTDVVHIDDGLNLSDPEAYLEQLRLLQDECSP